MYQTSKLRMSVLGLFVALLFSFAGYAQVVAGIRANGKILMQGDTINVCRGSSVVYQSSALGSLNISWQFNGGLPATMTGTGPVNIRYNTSGYDTTFQHAGTGVFADSMFIIVNVSDEKPVPGFGFLQDNLCGDENIQFTNTSAAGEPLSYLWSFGDGNTSTEQNPVHQFLSAIGLPGTQRFNVKLIVTNANACKDSISRAITIRKVPDAGIGNADPAVTFEPFNGNPTFKKCNNIPSYNFKFTNESSTIENNASYSINWGDGSQDSVFTEWPADAIIKHTFPTGSSTVTVRVTGKDGCTGIQKYIVFLGTVPAGGLASLGNTDICSFDSLRFAITNTENNPPGTSYSFYINDGSPIQLYKHAPPPIAGHYFTSGSCSFSSNNGLQTYVNAFGAYLTIENPCGSNSASVVPIYVSGKPRPGIALPSQVVCVNNVINLKNTSSFGNIITPGGNFSSACEDKGKKVWALFPATGYTIVSGTTGSLNGNPYNGAAWTDGSNMLNVRFTVEGVYEVKIYIFNDRCGIDSTFNTICVRKAPQASFSMNQRTSCGPARVDLINTSPVGDCLGDVYDWKVVYSDPQGCAPEDATAYSFTGGTKASSSSPSFLFNKIGRYIIRLTVKAANSSTAGCAVAIATDTFYVKGPPRAAVSAINTVCLNSSITPAPVITSCYSSGPFGYQWEFANGHPAISADSLPGTISYADTGMHSIRLIVTDSSCMLADTVYTVVNVVPLPDVVAGNDTTICSSEPVILGVTGGVEEFVYQWSPAEGLNDPAIANPTATLYYTGPDNDTTYIYYVTASLGGNCSKTDSVKIRVKRSPVITIIPLSAQICIGSSTQLVAGGADDYVWSPAETLINISPDTVIASPVITTDYTVAGVLANGCSGQQTVTIAVVPDAKAGFLAPDTVACSPVNINSLITGIPHEGNGTYSWYANDVLIGSNTTGEVPSYLLDNPGMSVVIKLVTISPAGCNADSMQSTFTTIPSVTASFTKDNFSSCAPLTVSFTNSSSSLANIEFVWDFGNGIGSAVAQPGPITFNAGPLLRDTVYQVILKATNGCDTSYFRDSVKVFAEARAKFGVDTTRGCSPFTFSIINTSLGNNNTYYWDFGDGKTDTTYSLGSFTHTYSTGIITTYTIRLIAENQCSRDTQLLNIVVSPNDIEPFIVANGDQLTGCAPHTATFTNSTVGASLVTWDFGDNTPPVITSNSQGSISHQFARAGTYNVIIQLQNDCSDTTIERNVEVYDPPSANFDADPLQVCLGQSVTVTNQSVNSNSYEWVWDDGETSSFINGQHNYKNAGTYNIMLVAQSVHSSGFVCADTTTKEVTVVNKVPAQVNVGPGKTCVPYALRVDAGDVTGANLIEWIIYDSSTAEKEFRIDGPTATHVYNVAGTYSVRLVVHTTTGCTDTATYQFNVFNTPHTVFEPQMISTCEHDTTINFTASTTHAGNEPLSYKWFINDQIEGTSLPFSFRFQAPMNNNLPSEFSVKAVAQGFTGCGDTSLSGKVMIQPLPTPSISVSPSMVLQQPDYQFTFEDLAVTNPHKTYLWDMDDRSLQTRDGQQVTYQYGDTGTYNVKLLVTDYSTACKAMDSVIVSILYVPGYLQVPNAMCPGCSNFSLRQFLPLGKGLKKYRLTIYSIWGQKIFETTSLNADGSPHVPWDGTFNGKPLQQDAYIWQIEAIYRNETEWKGMIYPGSNKPVKAGVITVIK